MVAEIGLFLLILAFCMSLTQAAGIWNKPASWRSFTYSIIPFITKLQFLFLLLSFLCLIYVHATSDFSVLNVADNSSSEQPLFFRISGAWGNHEGSMMLWVMLFSFFSFCLSCKTVKLPLAFRVCVLSCQGLMATLFIAFILFSSNPFERLWPAPTQGAELNPLLQDAALALHPPTLYMGYVGFSVAFSFAIAGMLRRKIDQEWASWLMPWVLISWIFLTLGIGAGSHWAYYELGWGGWWFWDAVENASLLPWLAGTALLHSLHVLEKRNGFKSWTILLAIICFSLCLLGTFLVRSGLVISVHSFATDPGRGIFILTILFLTIGSAFWLYARRGMVFETDIHFRSSSREAGILVNNLLLLTAMSTVLIGTLYPVILEAIGARSLAVGPPYYNQTFVPLFLPLLVFMGLAPFLPWKGGNWAPIFKRSMLPLLLTVLVTLVIFWWLGGNWVTLIGLGCGIWVMTTTLFWFIKQLRRYKGASFFSRFYSLPLSDYALFLSHFGLGILAVSIAGNVGWKMEVVQILARGDQMTIGPYQIVLQSNQLVEGPNFRSERLQLDVLEDGRKIASLYPEKRYFPLKEMVTSEAAILSRGWHDLYAAIAQENYPQGKSRIWIYVNPLIETLWGGIGLMIGGGLIGLIAAIRKKRRLLKPPLSHTLSATTLSDPI